LAALTGLAAHAQAQNVFYNLPTSQAQSEINAWASMYDTLVKTGQPAPGAATFEFTDANMNGPLFSILVAAKRTVGDVTGTNPCDINSTPGGGVDEFRANTTTWMTANTVSTDFIANPDGTTALLDAAAIDPGASLSVDGSELIASNLSATSVSASAGGGVAATYAAVSDTTLDWIADFTAASINYAATLDGHDNARRYVLGQPRTVDLLHPELPMALRVPAAVNRIGGTKARYLLTTSMPGGPLASLHFAPAIPTGWPGLFGDLMLTRLALQCSATLVVLLCALCAVRIV